MSTKASGTVAAALLCFSAVAWAAEDPVAMGNRTGSDHMMPADQSGTAAVESTTEGEVRQIDHSQGKITLKHGPLTNLGMNMGMTMVFRVQDPTLLQSLNVGDRIRFRAERLNGALTVTSIEKVAN